MKKKPKESKILEVRTRASRFIVGLLATRLECLGELGERLVLVVEQALLHLHPRLEALVQRALVALQAHDQLAHLLFD